MIREQRPSKLLIIADGPRASHPTDAERCLETREIVANIDWPCEVLRNYADVNMGCKRRVSSGLDWVFEQAEKAIVLEDDCLPNDDFFCSAKRYLSVMKTTHVSGPSQATTFRTVKNEATLRIIFRNSITAGAGRRGAERGSTIGLISPFGLAGRTPLTG